MNNEFKRVEIEVTDENTGENKTFLISNHQTYKNPYLMVSFMKVNHLGEIHWIEIEFAGNTPVNNFVKGLTSEQILKLYNNHNKKVQIGNFYIETLGIANDVQYNR